MVGKFYVHEYYGLQIDLELYLTRYDTYTEKATLKNEFHIVAMNLHTISDKSGAKYGQRNNLQNFLFD